jgi:hypothetical protein
MRLDAKDRAALRQVAVYGIGAALVCVALTGLILVLAVWVRLFLWVV